MKSAALLVVFSLIGCTSDDKSTPDDTGEAIIDDLDGDGYSPAQGDCDDANIQVYPGQLEVWCDDLDNDCVDGDDNDHDADGSICDDDCDDYDASVYPHADDVCGDGIDSDCDGALECDCDGDDYDGALCDGSDCDDTDDAINPDAADSCYDGLDTNCDLADDYDCDLDGYASANYGGDDCDDDNASLSPGESETCNDGIDNDCNVDTPDCDCDGDGYDAAACGGDDCDDTNVAISPVGDETSVNNSDDDCDGEIDEDAYCNQYFPLSNGSSAVRSYKTIFFDGSSYSEDVIISDYDSGTGDATLNRNLASALSSWIIDESWSCADGVVSMSGFTIESSGIPLLAAEYDTSRPVLPTETDLVEGLTWDYSYAATDASIGALWTAEGTMTIGGWASVDTLAGTYEDALVVDNAYVIVETGLGGTFSREGTVTYYFAKRVGLVYSVDTRADGTLAEERNLVSADGFYP